MNGFLLFLLAFGIIFFGTFSYMLKRYQAKELQEKRSLDLQILAYENHGDFKEIDQTLTEKLSRYHLGYKQGRTVRNICSHRFIGYTVQLFDFSFSAGDSSRSEEDMHCILIDLDDYHFPRFHITHKNIFNWFNSSGYAQMPKQLTPKWMPRTAFMFADEIDHLAVFSRTKYARSLKNIVSSQNFEKMLFRSEYIAIYFRGELPADIEHYQQQLAFAAGTFQTFIYDNKVDSQNIFMQGFRSL